MNHYEISQRFGDEKFGEFPGTHRENALGNMSRAAGYRDYDHACQADPERYLDLFVIEII
jgi:hypothetical protein